MSTPVGDGKRKTRYPIRRRSGISLPKWKKKVINLYARFWNQKKRKLSIQKWVQQLVYNVPNCFRTFIGSDLRSIEGQTSLTCFGFFIAFTKCNAILIQSVSRFFGTTELTVLASPQPGQITSCVHVHSHEYRFEASVQSLVLWFSAISKLTLVIKSEHLELHELWSENRFFRLCSLANGQDMWLENKNFRVVARSSSD